jgi:hypothetical protein
MVYPKELTEQPINHSSAGQHLPNSMPDQMHINDDPQSQEIEAAR